MNVRYRVQARDDLDAIFNYLNERNPHGAANVMRAIFAGVQFIADNPFGAPRTDDPTVRVMIVRRYRYKIFYAAASDDIDVLHVRHGAQRPWRGR